MAEQRQHRGAQPAVTPAPNTRTRVEERRAVPLRRERALGAGATPSGMVRTVWTDDDGQEYAVLVPVGHEDEASIGVVVGPPDLTALGWPAAITARLHAELFHRDLLTLADVTRRPTEVLAAIQNALRADVAAVMAVYRGDSDIVDPQEGDGNAEQDSG